MILVVRGILSVSPEKEDNSVEEEVKKNVTEPATVPYYVYEGTVARQARYIKWLVIALVICFSLAFASNVAWLVYESCFDTIAYAQDGEGINNVNLGKQGELINNGAESEDSFVEEPQASEGN